MGDIVSILGLDFRAELNDLVGRVVEVGDDRIRIYVEEFNEHYKMKRDNLCMEIKAT